MSEFKSFEEYVNDVVSKLPVSKPVFVANKDDNSLYFELKDKVLISPEDTQDPVEKLIFINQSESLIKNSHHPEKTHFRRGCNTSAIYCNITRSVMAVYEKNCGLKNPRQSRMYKWLYSVYNRYNHDSYEGFVALYRYIAKHSDVESRRFEGIIKDAAHANNVIAVLEKMRNKYEDK